MDKIFLIIGPSGTGKSKTVDALNLPDGFLVRHLDTVICEHNNETSISKYYSRIQNPAFLNKSIESINKLKTDYPDKTIIIDVGAGSIDFHECLSYYSKFTKVYLFADKQTLYDRLKQRNPNENRTINQYLSSEFSSHRIDLYNSASFSIDNSKLSIEQTAMTLRNIILKFDNT